MKSLSKGMQNVHVAALFALLVLGTSACTRDKNGISVNDMKWQESVELASGEVIFVKRHVRFRQERAAGLSGMLTAPVYETASIEIPGASSGFVMWDAPILPIYLDRDPKTNEWLVIGAEDGIALWRFNGRPCPPQWAFRLRDGTWHIQPVPKELIGRRPNLLVDLRVNDDRDLTQEEFQALVTTRKLNQLGPSGRVSPGMVAVGVVYDKQSRCATMDTPAFTSEFSPERAPGSPNLANFPRIP